jgi:hypothetical protein
MALYVKGKVSTTYAVLALEYGGRAVKGRFGHFMTFQSPFIHLATSLKS